MGHSVRPATARWLALRGLSLALGVFLLAGCIGQASSTVIVATLRPAGSPAASPSPTLQPSPLLGPSATPGPSPLPGSSPTPTPGTVTCADLDAAWGDWPTTIGLLRRLIAAGQSCGPQPLADKLYAAHYNFAMALEASGDIEAAIQQYRGAYRLDPRRVDALKALARLNGLPTPTPSACGPIDPALADPATPVPVDTTQLVYASGQRLMLGDEPYRIKGVNYYPRHAPWERFLEQSDLAEITTELDLIHQAGFNTIRIFLWYQPLFKCSDGQMVPNAPLFTKVDRILRMASRRGLKVIATLNDLPDLYIAPLYTQGTFSDAETAYIVRRYQASPAILAWDLRNEGDLDYHPRRDSLPLFSRDQVLGWLASTSQIVRENDPNHLITAGWWGDPTETDPYVDLLSFHHWDTADLLASRIDDYRTRSTKPMLLEEFGYPNWGVQDQNGASARLQSVAQTAEAKDLAGWMVWDAFDFQPLPGQMETYEHHYGLWTLDLQPKDLLGALPLP